MTWRAHRRKHGTKLNIYLYAGVIKVWVKLCNNIDGSSKVTGVEWCNNMSHAVKKVVSSHCEQTTCRSACASAHSDLQLSSPVLAGTIADALV